VLFSIDEFKEKKHLVITDKDLLLWKNDMVTI